MQFKGIKRGKNIELLEEINIPDGQEIIVEVKDYQLVGDVHKSINSGLGFGKAVEKFREEENLKELGIEPEEILEGVRDSSPGREVVW